MFSFTIYPLCRSAKDYLNVKGIMYETMELDELDGNGGNKVRASSGKITGRTYKEPTLNKWHTSFTEHDRRTRIGTSYYRQNRSECPRNSTHTRQNRSECTRNSTPKITRPPRTCGWHILLFLIF